MFRPSRQVTPPLALFFPRPRKPKTTRHVLGKLSNPFTENGELRFPVPRGQCAIKAENQTLRGGGRWQSRVAVSKQTLESRSTSKRGLPTRLSSGPSKQLRNSLCLACDRLSNWRWPGSSGGPAPSNLRHASNLISRLKNGARQSIHVCLRSALPWQYWRGTTDLGVLVLGDPSYRLSSPVSHRAQQSHKRREMDGRGLLGSGRISRFGGPSGHPSLVADPCIEQRRCRKRQAGADWWLGSLHIQAFEWSSMGLIRRNSPRRASV